MARANADETLPSEVIPIGLTRGRASFDTWAEAVSAVFDVGVQAETLPNFQFGLATWNLGQQVLTCTESIGQEFHRTPQGVARNGVDHILVQVYQSGSFTGQADRADFNVGAGDVCFIDTSRTLSTRATDFRNTTLVVPRALLTSLVADADALHGLTLKANTAMGQLLGRHLADLGRLAATLTPAEALSVADATTHLIAGCVGPSLAGAEVAPAAIANANLEAIRSYIERSLADPDLDADMICRAFGISRATLYRLFAPLSGVQDHIRKRRLARCFFELASPIYRSQRISEIAYRWGFANDASFSRAFRREFGLSPTDLRDSLERGTGRTYARQLAATSTGPQINRWIRGLISI